MLLFHVSLPLSVKTFRPVCTVSSHFEVLLSPCLPYGAGRCSRMPCIPLRSKAASSSRPANSQSRLDHAIDEYCGSARETREGFILVLHPITRMNRIHFFAGPSSMGSRGTELQIWLLATPMRRTARADVARFHQCGARPDPALRGLKLDLNSFVYW